MLDTESPIEAATPADLDDIDSLMRTLFHNEPDATLSEVHAGIAEPGRSLVIRSGGTVVAHAGVYTRGLTVPGTTLPAAHVTDVGVAPSHRRRGLLSRLMRQQLRDVRAAGREPITVLWASEGPIYPRFGYGQATQQLSLHVDTNALRLVAPVPPDPSGGPEPDVTFRIGDPLQLRSVIAPLYERVRVGRPGWSDRTEPWWRYVLTDYPSRRFGPADRQVVITETPAGPAGYALWRSRAEWDVRGPRGQVMVDEVVADDPAAYQALWRFLLSIDLTRSVSFHHAAIDEPLQYLVDEPRQLGAGLNHGLWVRIVDLPAALAARSYAADVDVVFDVTDPLLPENAGRWRLTVASGTAECTRTDAPAELACDVRDLAAAYLGGPSLGTLATAGRVREVRPGVLPRASAAFGWHRAPSGLGVF
ncbi:GNAT family N-acetyltransferase [Plantactinospora sp. S1510]|uniref:GNAT family N-acetyltransferase n=1 Tax=Plantactinospora alkalitolerans TaxID=2789879 RepID=A0ABS0GNF4_9ACTN|nr:GNAT family N-acetyltransferase [Plantactinospora alkalitolerans]MBF9127589.1 GNAT family N-acetyltransferase [Plantactinospora alkalitolerans]